MEFRISGWYGASSEREIESEHVLVHWHVKLPFGVGVGGNGTQKVTFTYTVVEGVWVLACLGLCSCKDLSPQAHKEEPAVHQAGSVLIVGNLEARELRHRPIEVTLSRQPGTRSW